MASPIPIIAVLFVLSAVCSSSSPPEPEDSIRVVYAERVIHLTGPIARVTLTLEVENDATAASHASEVLLAFKPWEVEHLAIVKATRVEGRYSKRSYEPLSVQASDPPETKNGARLYSVLLSTHLKPGETTTLEVVYVLTDVLDPHPAKSVNPSSASQMVYYFDMAVLLSPYHVLEQVTYIKMPSDMLWSKTVVDPTSSAGAEVKYGPYYNQMPVTFLPISLRYVNRPFLVFEKLERKVDIPRWGPVKVTDQYKMRHDHAWYKRIFSRPDCHKNWPTAHTFLSSNKDLLYFRLKQEYGWDCTFTIEYGLPLEDFLFQSEDGRRYINLTFGVPLLDNVVNDFTTKVVLPEGSKNPEPIVPFPIEAIPRRTYWQWFWVLLHHDDTMAQLAGRALEKQTSYSYVAGRWTVELKKKKLVAEHNVPIQIHLTGSIARVILTLDVKNAAAASHASRVLLAFTAWEVEHLAIVKATKAASDEPLRVVQASHLHATKNIARLYSVVLSTHLKPGEKTTLEVVYVLTDVLDPYPARAVSPSAASQLVYYHDSAVLLSPYHVEKQVTYIKTSSKRIESSTTWYPTSRAGAEVKYGSYYDQEPGTFLPINLHYENRPFIVFQKLERKVDIPLRGHIRVTDKYRMPQETAWYKRIFSFFDKDERIFERPECPRIWPTAHELMSSNKDRLYLQLRQGPRYGWDCTFTISYGFPEDSFSQSEDGRRYINLTFGVPDLLKTVVNDFITVVLLPEGSKNPQPIVSFPMEATSKETYWQWFWALLQRHDAKARLAGRAIEMQTGYSYYAGRATVELKRKKLVAEHSVPFQVYYESYPIFTLAVFSKDIFMPTDPTLWSAVLLVIAGCISYFYYYQ